MKTQKLINQYLAKLESYDSKVLDQQKIVQQERRNARAESVNPSEYVDYIWESRDLKSLIEKRQLVYQFLVDLGHEF